MKQILTLLFGAMVLAGFVIALGGGASTGPEAIVHGRDACAHCRMSISGPGFAGERRDAHGKLTKYDDIGCLLLAMWRAHEETPDIWVEDHPSGRLIPLLSATLVRDSDVATPMGYGLLAFERREDAVRFTGSHKGEVVELEAVLRDTKRLQKEVVSR